MNFADLAASVSNWNRWGPDDELGCLNFITDEKKVEAAKLVRKGTSFSLAIPLDGSGPQDGETPGVFRSNPFHVATRTGNDPSEVNGAGGTAHFTDDVLLQLFLQAGTQWDSLAHVYYDDLLYNGFLASGVTAQGASHLGFGRYYDRFVTRGVLLDIAALHGTTTLQRGHVIDEEQLDAAAASVDVRSGDIVLVRTGLMATHDATQSWGAFQAGAPGLDYSTAAWFHERDVAAVASDNMAVEYVNPEGGPGGLSIPMHMLALRDMGMPLGEFWYLEDLAADCVSDGISDFMLIAPGLRVPNALGSPVTPIAIK